MISTIRIVKKGIFLLVVFLIGFCFTLKAQFSKRFVKENGKAIKDSSKAAAYILYKKTGVDLDSVWTAMEYDMRNKPILKGHFLDEEFTIPHGRFDFYKQATNQIKTAEHKSVIDTLTYISESGFFNNGMKVGTWIDYFPDQTVQFIKNYDNDKLNGLFEEYSYGGNIYSRGNFKEGQRDGETYLFRPDSSIKSIVYYRDGEHIGLKQFDENKKEYIARAGFNFEYYIYRYLKKMAVPVVPGSVLVAFTVAENGKLKDVKIEIGVSAAIDQAVMDAVSNSPTWTPARENNRKIEQKMKMSFNYDNRNYGLVIN